jgi:hypothetical protein
MKTVIVLSLMSLFACNDHKQEPVDQTRTTSAIVVEPTLHDGHAAEPNVDQEQNMDMDKDVDQTEMSGTDMNDMRDGG